MILTDYELPAWAEQTMQITSVIVLIILVVLSLLLVIWLIWASLESEKAKNEFIKNCNEHDKAVIADYRATAKYPKIFRRKKQ